MPIFLETERFILRQFTPADEEHLVALDSDPEVMRYLTGGAPTPRTVIHDTILPAFLNSYQRWMSFGVWAAIAKGTGQFLGWFSFRPVEGEGSERVELGYRLRQD